MITINWGREDKTVLKYEFEGHWSIDDLLEALDAGVDVAQRYDHDMDVIVDLSKSALPNLLGLSINRAFDRAANRSDEHKSSTGKEPGLVVIVTSNPIIRNSLSTMLTLYQGMGSQLAVANTLQDAQTAIDAYRRGQSVAATA